MFTIYSLYIHYMFIIYSRYWSSEAQFDFIFSSVKCCFFFSTCWWKQTALDVWRLNSNGVSRHWYKFISMSSQQKTSIFEFWYLKKLFIRSEDIPEQILLAKFHYMFTIYSLCVHCMFTICSPFIHYIFTICSSYIHETFTAYSLYVHYIFAICSLYIHYIFIIYSLHIHYIFTIYSLYINYMVITQKCFQNGCPKNFKL